MKFSKILALCLIALLTIAAFVACDNGEKNEQTTDQSTEAPIENTTDSTDAPTTEDVTTAPEEETTEPETETTTEEETTAPEEEEIKVITIAEA
ncbi:MAG: hypothetical protein II330_07245, partial [Clostridia bacterium]|nr:hypothetical protein [Clostridia bacterium]